MQRKTRRSKRTSGTVWVPAEIRSARRRHARERVAKGDDPGDWLPDAAKPPAARNENRRPRQGRLDLNEASFEELRDLGLSVTQSSRLIAYRETRGAFSSVDDIEELPGFGKVTLKLLRSRAYANAS